MIFLREWDDLIDWVCLQHAHYIIINLMINVNILTILFLQLQKYHQIIARIDGHENSKKWYNMPHAQDSTHYI